MSLAGWIKGYPSWGFERFGKGAVQKGMDAVERLATFNHTHKQSQVCICFQEKLFRDAWCLFVYTTSTESGGDLVQAILLYTSCLFIMITMFRVSKSQGSSQLISPVCFDFSLFHPEFQLMQVRLQVWASSLLQVPSLIKKVVTIDSLGIEVILY